MRTTRPYQNHRTKGSNPMQGDVTTRAVSPEDMPAIRSLHALVFGPGRFARTAYRIREGTPDISPFCRVAIVDDAIAACLRMTPVTIGSVPGALLLGPLAVHPAQANRGYGRQLIAEVINRAREAGLELILLVGDQSYYGRLGFIPVPPGQILLPGPVDHERVLAFELRPHALTAFRGMTVGLKAR